MMGKLEKTEQAIAAGAPVDHLGDTGTSALMLAATYGHMPVIEALLAAGANADLAAIDRGPDRGRTALMQAADSFFAKNRDEVIWRLAAAGADLEARDAGGATALMVAVRSGSGNTLSMPTLLELGADPDVADRDGNTPLMVAVAGGATRLIEMLKKAGAKEDGVASVELIAAAEKGDADAVRRWIAAGADVDHRLHRTPLMEAAINGHTEVVEILLAAGADVDRGDEDPL